MARVHADSTSLTAPTHHYKCSDVIAHVNGSVIVLKYVVLELRESGHTSEIGKNVCDAFDELHTAQGESFRNCRRPN